MIQVETDPVHKPSEGFLGGFGNEFSHRGGTLLRFLVDSEQAGNQETIGQEDQIPMTLDSPKISELVVLKAKDLLGIPEKRLYVPPLAVCLEDSGSFPPDLIGSEGGRRTRKRLIVIAS
jgi:hypothetical protein